jgi:hypothetical protein
MKQAVPVNVPSTDWMERIAPDEAQRHAADAAELVRLQAACSQKFGKGRALHRKQIIGLQATLRVHEGLPAHARHGLFALPGSFDARVRISDGGPDVHSDRRPDIRGFAFRAFGPKGPAALGGSTDHQDFLLINRSAFAFADSKPFVGLVRAAGSGGGALLMWALPSFGPLGAIGQVRKLAAGLAVPFTGFATTAFHSAAPIACGPYAVRVRLLPPQGQNPVAGASDWRADLLPRLQAAPLVYQLQLQFFADEATTPIEDASVEWPESTAPYVTVADLVVHPPPADAAGFDALIEASVFDPWQALVAHRPLGEVMRARKVAYFGSQKARGAA